MTSLRTNRIRDAADFATVFDVSRETLTALATFERLLRQWQKTINLVAPSTLDDIWHRHFADSAQVVGIAWNALGENARTGEPSISWVDLGSGGGFPGLVVGHMLAERGNAALTLVESDQRKAAFLREVVRETGLKQRITVDIVVERIEGPANRSKAQPVSVVSARALAPLPKLLDWATPYFGGSTIGVFLKGREARSEVGEVAVSSDWSFDLQPSLTNVEASIVVVRRKLVRGP